MTHGDTGRWGSETLTSLPGPALTPPTSEQLEGRPEARVSSVLSGPLFILLRNGEWGFGPESWRLSSAPLSQRVPLAS